MHVSAKSSVHISIREQRNNHAFTYSEQMLLFCWTLDFCNGHCCLANPRVQTNLQEWDKSRCLECTAALESNAQDYWEIYCRCSPSRIPWPCWREQWPSWKLSFLSCTSSFSSQQVTQTTQLQNRGLYEAHLWPSNPRNDPLKLKQVFFVKTCNPSQVKLKTM